MAKIIRRKQRSNSIDERNLIQFRFDSVPCAYHGVADFIKITEDTPDYILIRKFCNHTQFAYKSVCAASLTFMRKITDDDDIEIEAISHSSSMIAQFECMVFSSKENNTLYHVNTKLVESMFYAGEREHRIEMELSIEATPLDNSPIGKAFMEVKVITLAPGTYRFIIKEAYKSLQRPPWTGRI